MRASLLRLPLLLWLLLGAGGAGALAKEPATPLTWAEVTGESDAARLEKRIPEAGPEALRAACQKWKAGDAKGALAEAEAAVKQAPDLALAYELRGRLHAETGDLAKAKEDYEHAIDRNPKGAELYAARAWTERQEDDTDAARADYDLALALDPKLMEARYGRALARLQAGEIAEAEEEADRMLEADSESVVAFHTRALAKVAAGDFEEAIADFDEALKRNPRHVASLLLRGDCENESGDWRGGLKDFNRVLELDPQNTSVYRGRGAARKWTGDVEGALTDLNRALELDPKDGDSYEGRADCQMILQHWPEAVADFRKTAALCADNLVEVEEKDYPHIFIWLARTQQGQAKDANDELALYLKERTAEGTTEWSTLLCEFLLGRKSEEAVLTQARVSQVELASGEQCEGWYYVGMKRLLKGDKAGAREAFRKCLAVRKYDFREHDFAEAEIVRFGPE